MKKRWIALGIVLILILVGVQLFSNLQHQGKGRPSIALEAAPLSNPPTPAIAKALDAAVPAAADQAWRPLTPSEITHIEESDREAERLKSLSYHYGKLTSRQRVASGELVETYTNADGNVLTRIYNGESVSMDMLELPGGDTVTITIANGESSEEQEDGHVETVIVQRGSQSWTNTYNEYGAILSKEENIRGEITCVIYEGKNIPVARRDGECVLEEEKARNLLDKLL